MGKSLISGLAILKSDLIPVGMRCEIKDGKAVRIAPLAAPFVASDIDGIMLNPVDIEALKEATHD